MRLSYPSINVKKNGNIFISFVLNDKRIRLSSGKRIGLEIYPNSYPSTERFKIAKILCSEVYNHLLEGGSLDGIKKGSDIEYLRHALDNKLKENLSRGYVKNLTYIFNELEINFKGSKSLSKSITIFLNKYTCGTSYNTLKKHITVLVNEAIKVGLKENPIKDIKSRKSKARMHKPFKDINLVLDEVKAFNHNLYLCCLFTYGCLLRPHREIRELRYSDFSNNMSQINLEGKRNKSGRNRIVPVPSFILEHLDESNEVINIFSGKLKPPNRDYFKTLWNRFKKQSKTLGENQTLYSFRHTGAIDIYTRTKDLSKLQSALGHSSLKVSLTYLRGLEVATLSLEDMPSL